MKPTPHAGSLFVIVAPSGAGKTSLVRALLEHQRGLAVSVSFTTRTPRPGEREGIDYFFVNQQEFDSRRAAGEFLEWAQVHGNSYATSRRWIDEQVGAGNDILLEIDWQGAMQVRAAFPDTVGIFIAPPSIESLRERLTRRGQDSAEVIEQRVAAAKAELREAGRFEHVIINQEFAIALHQLEAIVEAARTRYEQQRARNPALFVALGVGTNR